MLETKPEITAKHGDNCWRIHDDATWRHPVNKFYDDK